MGLFNSYLKPGKGVDKNEPKKRGVFLYVDILVQKFSKLIGANCLLFITSILWIAVLYLFAAVLIANTDVVERITNVIVAAGNVDAAQTQGSVTVLLQIYAAMGIFVLWGSGPSSAAYSYVNRSFTRGEPVWVWSDGKDKFKENLKQSFIVIVIDTIILLFGVNAMMFYYDFYTASHSVIWMILSYIMVLVFVIYTFMHPYIYQIMVTFDCSLKDIYKNALLLSLAKLPGSVFCTALNIAVITLLFTYLNPVVAALFLGVFGLCITRYVSEFYAARVIDKTILRNMKSKTYAAPKIEYTDEDDALMEDSSEEDNEE